MDEKQAISAHLGRVLLDVHIAEGYLVLSAEAWQIDPEANELRMSFSDTKTMTDAASVTAWLLRLSASAEQWVTDAMERAKKARGEA